MTADQNSERTARTTEIIVRARDAAQARLTAAAARLHNRRPEPTLRVLVADALDGPHRNEGLRRHYRRELRLLVDGLPAYLDFADEPVPARPGFGDVGPSGVTDTELQDFCTAIDRYSASTRLVSARKRNGQLPTYTRDAYGRGAAARFRTAVRKLFARAEVRRWTDGDPTADLKLRPGCADFAVHLTEAQFRDVREVAATTGRDRELDLLLVDFLDETGWRREGVLNCTLDGIDVPAGSARTSMKNGKTQQSPANRQLLADIRAMAVARGAREPWDAVFRGRDGRPITRKHFESFSKRLKRHKPWAAPLWIGPHAIRRRTLTEVTAQHGVSAGLAWANHSRRSGPPLLRYLAEPSWEEKQAIAADVFGPLDAPVPPPPSAAAAFAVPYGGPPAPRPQTGAPPDDPRAAVDQAAEPTSRPGAPGRSRGAAPAGAVPRPLAAAGGPAPLFRAVIELPAQSPARPPARGPLAVTPLFLAAAQEQS